jgi:hypothetical protein
MSNKSRLSGVLAHVQRAFDIHRHALLPSLNAQAVSRWIY